MADHKIFVAALTPLAVNLGFLIKKEDLLSRLKG